MDKTTDKALPCATLIPNADTIKAMQAARRGEMMTVHSAKALFEGLDADD